MKNLYKLFAFLLLTTVFFGCEEDLIIFDADNGQTALSFGETAYNVSIPLENLSLEIPVNSTTRSAADRNFSAVVNVDGTTPGTSGEYAIGNITIPAGEFVGVLTVDFTFANIGVWSVSQYQCGGSPSQGPYLSLPWCAVTTPSS